MIYKQDGTHTVWGQDDEARDVPYYRPRPGHSGRDALKALGLREMARGEDRALCGAVVDCGGGVLLYGTGGAPPKPLPPTRS